MTRLNKKSLILLPILLVLAVLIYFGYGIQTNAPASAGANAGGEGQKEIKTEITPVQVWEVYSAESGSTAWFPGTVRIEKDRILSFKVSGVVTDVCVNVGTRLFMEKVIARLDNSQEQENIRQLDTTLGKARLESFRAAANYDRVHSQYKTKAASIKDLEAAATALLKTQQAERNIKKQLQAAQQTLENHELKLQEKGAITAVNVKAGDKVEAGQPVATFSSTYPVQVTIMAPAVFITQIMPDGKGRVRFKGVGDRAYVAGVQGIGGQTAASGGRFPVTLTLARLSGVQTGMEAEASFRLPLKTKGKSFIIPPDAVLTDGENTFVYVVKPTGGDYGAVERRQVSTGILCGFGQEITSGLSDGEMVVMHGIGRLQNGMKVKWR